MNTRSPFWRAINIYIYTCENLHIYIYIYIYMYIYNGGLFLYLHLTRELVCCGCEHAIILYINICIYLLLCIHTT